MSEERSTLRELAGLFLRLGITSFGGPAAHIAMMHAEVVRRRGWLSEERFLDLVSAANLIPGPNSTELAIHIGRQRAGVPGLCVAGCAFILPAMLISAACGYLYVRFAALPAGGALLYGVKPVILAIVVQAIWNLAPRAGKSWPLRALGLGAALAAALGANELVVLFASGAIAMLLAGTARARGSTTLPAFATVAPAAKLALGATLAAPVGMSSLFWVFFKIGSVLFGSGYVLLAFLRADLVARLHWLSEAQLIDAVAVGQVTPGPVFTTATFIGYVLAGPVGALVATAGIFLPAFGFVFASAPLLPRLRASRPTAAFLDGVNVASLALMAVVTLQLARGALVDLPSGLLAIAAVIALVRYELNSTWLVAFGMAAGLALRAIGR